MNHLHIGAKVRSAGQTLTVVPGVNYSERRASIILSGAVEQDH